jgi:hypothetical protein
MLFGPGHFVRLRLRLKSEIRTQIGTYFLLDPKLSVSELFVFGEHIVFSTSSAFSVVLWQKRI